MPRFASDRRFDTEVVEGLSRSISSVLVPIAPALGMQPGVATGFRPEGNDGVPILVGFVAPGAAIGIGSFRMMVEPFDDAAFEGDGLRFGVSVSTVYFCDMGSLVQERLPVSGDPPLSGRFEQFDDLGLVALDRVHHVNRRLEVRVENQIGAIDPEPYAAGPGHADRFGCTHTRFLQRWRSVSADDVCSGVSKGIGGIGAIGP